MTNLSTFSKYRLCKCLRKTHSTAPNHDDTIHDPVSNLNRNLASFGLSIDPVVGDGDCAFSSIVKQLHKLPEFINKEPYFVEHLYGLGLSKSVEEDAYWLRQLFVDNVQSNKEYQSVAGMNPDRLNEETELFRERGTYSGNLGDLVIKVCADVPNYQYHFKEKHG